MNPDGTCQFCFAERCAHCVQGDENSCSVCIEAANTDVVEG
jgi:hypothetical protein